MQVTGSGKQFRTAALAALLALGSAAVAQQAQVKERPIPRLVKKDGRYALMVDGAPYLMLGAQAHNSSAWPAMLPKVWPAIEYLHANTLEIPVYWEQFEATPGAVRLLGGRHHHHPGAPASTSGWFCSGSAPGRTAASTTCRSG